MNKRFYIPRRYVLVLITFSLSLLLYIDRICISAAKGEISESMGFTDTQMGWIFSAFAIGYALMQTPAGIIADRFGPRRVITIIVGLWSTFTALTGAAWNYVSMLVIRFLFGGGEAGAFPSISRAVFTWIPIKERGIVTGINFSGSRIGAAFALPLVAWLIGLTGWRSSFFILGVIGILWAIFWFGWFRDDPLDHLCVSNEEKEYIKKNRQQISPEEETSGSISVSNLLSSKNMWFAMAQYFGSNFIFFFCLTWMFAYLEQKYHLSAVKTGMYGMAPLLAGAVGNWFSGWLVDFIYRHGRWTWSRRIPAITGFILVIIGMLGILQSQSIGVEIIFLSIAVFGADMTLSPSWSFCVDIGKKHSGTVSGTMNMAGNIGSLITSIAFPYLRIWTGSDKTFFFLAGVIALLSIGFWLGMKPDKAI